VVAVPLVAVTNTVVGYLRVYGREQALRHSPPPHGSTSLDAAAAAEEARPAQGRTPGEAE
jgi:hypothetical protein